MSIIKGLYFRLCFLIRKFYYSINNKCIFSNKVSFDSKTHFEGRNTVGSNSIISNSYIGYSSYISNNSKIINTKIGKYSCIGPNTFIAIGRHPVNTFVSIHPAFYSTLKQSGYTYVKNNKFNEYKYIDNYSLIIGNDVWVGSNVLFLEGITIGDGAVIGAGSVVTKDVPPYSIVAGVPAKVKKFRFNSNVISKLMDIKWWDKDKAWIEKNSCYFDDINTFLKKASNK